MTRTEKENLVPVWERITISLEEAAAYSGIGVRKLRDMTDKPECNYVIWVGNRRMIKRKKFDEYRNATSRNRRKDSIKNPLTEIAGSIEKPPLRFYP